MRCNARFAKVKKRLKGTQAKTLARKVQLVEEQLQLDPTNEQTRIMSESQGRFVEFFLGVSRTQQPPLCVKMAQVWGHLLKDLLRLPPHKEKKDSPQ
jgi:hypothetical protein